MKRSLQKNVATHGEISRCFGNRVLNFFDELRIPENLPYGIETIYPYATEQVVKELTKTFFQNFFSDTQKRVFVLGINPGRFGSGATGVPFTDAFALEECCLINNDLTKKRELTSKFIYDFIEAQGGAQKFYKQFFLSAVSPIGFLKDGKNYNYYDSAVLFQTTKSFIVDSLKKQIGIGAKETVILLGSGKNAKYFSELNDEFNLFKKVFVLPHPRYIMQYKKKEIGKYLIMYEKVFENAKK